jgi:hypothetical protein
MHPPEYFANIVVLLRQWQGMATVLFTLFKLMAQESVPIPLGRQRHGLSMAR